MHRGSSLGMGLVYGVFDYGLHEHMGYYGEWTRLGSGKGGHGVRLSLQSFRSLLACVSVLAIVSGQ